jgi:acyl-CoA hydrolase
VTRAVTGVILGSAWLYEFAAEHAEAFAVRAVSETHDPATLAGIERFTAINGALEVDLTGQVNAEQAGGRYVGAVGGQADFARGAMYAEGGQAFVVLRSTTRDGRSRIRAQLTDGSVVTTLKNTVDHVVTEWGIAELRGRPIAERARALIGIAHPDHRDALEAQAREAGILPRPAAVSGSAGRST